MVLSGSVEPGDKVVVDLLEGDLHFDVEKDGARLEQAEVQAAQEAVAAQSSGPLLALGLVRTLPARLPERR